MIQTIHTWQTPKQRGKNKKERTKDCPICNGSGKRMDKKTLLERQCVACVNGQINLKSE